MKTAKDVMDSIIGEWFDAGALVEILDDAGFVIVPKQQENKMGWTGEGNNRIYQPEYRVSERDGGFEPQMQYQVNHVERWFALLPNGNMADPDIWKMGASGESYVRVILPSREMAERAILRAKTTNGQNALAALPQS